MPTHDAATVPSIQDLIDRMIDGAMSPQELRMCIQRLDTAPGGWRRCALTFLEAQSWGEAFRSLNEATCDRSHELAAVPELRPETRTRALLRSWVRTSVAAGIALVAFSLGWMSHGLNARSRPAMPPGKTVPANLVTNANDAAGPAATKPLVPGMIPGLPLDRVPTVREVARLRIGSDDQAAAVVPILAGPGISGRWLMEQPPPVSEHDRAVWRRQGYQLEQRRQLVSVPLADGRRAAVPVDHVQVRYVGHEPL